MTTSKEGYLTPHPSDEAFILHQFEILRESYILELDCEASKADTFEVFQEILAAHARTESARWKALAEELAGALRKAILWAECLSLRSEIQNRSDINWTYINEAQSQLAKFRSACGEGK